MHALDIDPNGPQLKLRPCQEARWKDRMASAVREGDPTMRRRRVTCALTALLLLAAPLACATNPEKGESTADAAPSQPSERKPWDAARMTDLSAQLAQATSEVRRAFRREPNFRNPQTPNRRSVHQMEQTLRDLEIATRRLASQVSGGADFEGTSGTARRIGMLLNDADVTSRSIMTSAFMAEKIQPAMTLINEVAPYYGSGPLFDPDTMQRLDRAPNPGNVVAPE
jgi:hypothetical protein